MRTRKIERFAACYRVRLGICLSSPVVDCLASCHGPGRAWSLVDIAALCRSVLGDLHGHTAYCALRRLPHPEAPKGRVRISSNPRSPQAA